MRSLHFAIELRRAGLDVGVLDALVFNIPVEFSLELMAVVSPDFFDPEGEFPDDMIDEVDSIGLRVAFIYFKSPHSGCIVDGGILEPACLLTGFSYESQELDVHLDVMAGDLFLISFGMNFASARPVRKAVQVMAA